MSNAQRKLFHYSFSKYTIVTANQVYDQWMDRMGFDGSINPWIDK